MSPHDRDKLNRIEELKGRLFSKNYQTKIEHRDSFTHLDRQDVPDGWEDAGKDGSSSNFSSKFFMKTSMFKKFFIFSIVFFALTIFYASYVFFAGSNTVSNENIDISILGNNFTAGGEELSLIVGIANKNSSSLDLVDLVIEYPKSSAGGEPGLPTGTERSRISLGTIPAGALRNENIKIILFGEQGSIRPIKISIEYRVEGSNAIFLKEKFFDVTINSTPLNLSLEAPSTISANQNITLNLKATLNSTQSPSDIIIKLNYPVGFQFISSVPAPSLGNNIWNLDRLTPGKEQGISIVGKMIDVFDGEEKIFHISGGLQSISDKFKVDVVLNSLSHAVSIQKAFVEARLFINSVSEREYAVDSKTPINGTIEWTNNLDTKVNDLEIRAKIVGNAVNRQTINAQRGFYNSSTEVITWDKNSNNELREIDPGDSCSVNFSFSPVSLFSSTGGILTNPSINIDISISGKQQIEGYTVNELTNSESGVVRIISDLGLATKALYYSGPFKNTGPIPPKVEQETTYTIVWSLSNTANNISKGIVRTTLPPWVNFVGTMSPASEDLTYNASTREITWNIGSIPRGTGISSAGRSVSFQVALTPSLSQVRTAPTLTNDAVLTGYDDFAKVDVRVLKTALRTVLENDPAFPSNGGIVVE